jgi:ArsR family metal-binding transcriptional regulator
MTLDQIVKIQSIVDKRAIRSDTLEFLNQERYSYSKKTNIRFGDMHIDHFLTVVSNGFVNINNDSSQEDKTKEMFESIKKKILQEFNHGNH